MTADISRHSLRPAQKFTGVVRQQGRLPLDSDETEDSDLGALMLRQMVTETICERGSPDDGFRISAPVVANQALNFTIAPGAFYLGGSRLASDGDQYRDQPDWLSVTIDNPGPAIPAANTQRIDLVWLSGWEQTVTATEDSELFERALGGPDTTARRRMMWRVRVLAGTPDECGTAFADLVTREFAGGTLDGDGCTILSNARLTIGFTQLDPLEDLCRPTAQEGFLGARNEAFRVMVTQPGRFIWGRDNAAPLYRVQVANDANGNPRKIVFLTLPRDEFGWPLAGMTVELLRWGSLLDNREKAAEPQGLLLRVLNGFDPASNAIQVGANVPAAWQTFFATPAGQAAVNPRDEAPAYFFLRVWTGGGQGNAVDHAMNVGSAVALGETGLTATFTTTGMAGDYWIVSARPNTPTLVTPWKLLDGAPPAGPRRVIAPLALLPWNGPTPQAPIDCRHRFRPLCEVGTCCRVTVGDGRNSFGDVLSIQEAVQRLPAEGGEICIHPGEYDEHVLIENRSNITITGCGRTTLWQGVDGRLEPLLTIRGSSGIHVRRIAMASQISEAVYVEDGGGGASRARPSRATVLEDLLIVCADKSGIIMLDGDFYIVRRCQVALAQMSQTLADDPLIGRAAAIFMSGNDLLVEHCRVGVESTKRSRRIRVRDGDFKASGSRLRLAAGGIHIGANSRRVIIRDNIIQGGNGHGITLGSVQFVPKGDGKVILAAGQNHYTEYVRKGYYLSDGYGSGAVGYFGLPFFVDDAGCIRNPGTPPKNPPSDDPLDPESGGVIRDIRIQRNDISQMGFSGISAHVFSGLGDNGLSDAIVVEAIDIAENRITACMINEIGTTTPLLRLFIGWGGIALSICSDATIRDNTIAANGAKSREPICGIFIAIAEDVKIERNRIEQNGIDPQGQALNPGQRGGIHIGISVGGVASASDIDEPRRAADRPALVVNGNVVDAPSGRALKAILLGPAIVLGNRLTGAGRSALFSNVFGSLLAAGFALSRVGAQLISPREDIDLTDYVLLELLADVLGGDAVNLISLCVAEDLILPNRWTPGTVADPQRLRGGEMLVNDNQISLRLHSTQTSGTVSSVLLLGLDDVSFCDNQAEVENDVYFVTNVLAVATTLRLSTNRLQEGAFSGIVSAFTFAMLNQTSSNQSTHCIIATGLPAGLVITDNRSFVGLVSPEFCQRLGKVGLSMSDNYNMKAGLAART